MTTLRIRFTDATDRRGTAARVLFVADGRKLSRGGMEVDQAGAGHLGRALDAARFTGKKGTFVELLAPAGLACRRLLVAGIGAPASASARTFEDLGGEVGARLQTLEAEVCADFSGLAELGIDAGVAAAHFAHGLELRNWRMDGYRTKLAEDKQAKLASVLLAGAPRTARALVARLQKVAAGVAFAKELTTEPANVLYPESFAARVKARLAPLGVKVTVLDERKLAKLGAGSMLAVAQGSARPPRLLALEWNGSGKRSAAPLALVGKGVTFDTGGISLKPAQGMEEMKFDMGGAATVAGSLLALAGRKARARVVGVCGLAENMPDGRAQRPGDVVTSMSGQTIEVINTDAEGRLVLNDCFTWTQRTYHPAVMLDFATLTGAIINTFAHHYAGVFCNADGLWEKLQRAGDGVGDLLWRQPLSESGGHYDEFLDSAIADMKNIGPREAGSITAAQFLQRFVEPGVEWAHLDIAGTVWRSKAGPLHDKGATGFGVRLVDRFVADHWED